MKRNQYTSLKRNGLPRGLLDVSVAALPTPRSALTTASTNPLEMPTGQVDTIIQETAQSDQLQSQVKLCASCHGPLSNDPPNSNPNRSILSETAPIEPFCATCTILFFSPRSPSNPAERRSICADDGARLDSSHDFAVVPQPSPLHIDAQHPDDAEMSSPSSLESDGVFHRSQSTPQAAPPPRSPPCQRTPLKINTTSPAISAISSPSVALSSIALSPGNSRRHDDPVLSPDPLIDITRLRVRSKTHHCLYPGASFQGTQKSGRNSYDVNVTIVVRLDSPLAMNRALKCSHRTSTSIRHSSAGIFAFVV